MGFNSAFKGLNIWSEHNYMIWYDIYLLTVSGLSPGGSTHCHDTVLRYAVTLQVCTHPNGRGSKSGCWQAEFGQFINDSFMSQVVLLVYRIPLQPRNSDVSKKEAYDNGS
jgi:hypothetical protein